MSTSFLLGRPIFRCELLVSGSVIPGVDPYPTKPSLRFGRTKTPPCLRVSLRGPSHLRVGVDLWHVCMPGRKANRFFGVGEKGGNPRTLGEGD